MSLPNVYEPFRHILFTDATEHHFTGKERDSESGNDYFGARYYASTMGRFMSPDPKMASGHAMNPQSWNRYSYSLNNPLKFFDPDGKEAILFYRAPDSGKSSLQDFGHVFIYVRNEKTGRSGVFDYYREAGKSAVHRSVDAARRDAHAGLSIPTTPEQADKMLDKMDALTKANPAFNADTASKTDIITGNVNDCVTTTESILGAGGIKDSSISPTGLWNDLSTDQNEDPSRLTGNPWDATDGTRTGDLGTGPANPITGVILGDVGQPPPDLTQTGTPPPQQKPNQQQ
jgi:RHS repeat-associated protein